MSVLKVLRRSLTGWARESWAKTRAKVTREVRQVAEELLQLYAQRQALEGHGFQLDLDAEQMYQEFEATFPV
jgi:transcription-repair coupling factor (superfamily II helicase)